MALNAEAVRVAGTGEVYFAAENTAAPTNATSALAADWKGLGYTSTDGVQFTLSRNTTDLDAWQGSKLRVVTNSEPVTLTFRLMETKSETLLLAFGGGTLAGDGTYVPPEEGTNTVRAICVDFTDGTLDYRYYFPRVQVEGDVSFALTRSAEVGYDVTLGVLSVSVGQNRWKLFSDDTTRLTYMS